MKNMLLLLLLLPLVLLSACATKPTVAADQLKTINKVAIVGFTSLAEVPDTLAKMPNAPTMMGVPNLNTFAKQTDTAANMLKQFSSDLRSKLRWNVMTADQLVHEDVYGDLYANIMKNWKNMMTPDRRYQMHFVKNVLPFEQSHGFTQDVRDHMMNTLKVDALVEVQFHSSMASPFKVLNIGNKHGQTVAKFYVYKRGIKDPVWTDDYAEGEKTSKTLGFQFGGYDMRQEPELFQIYEEATKLATVSLFNRKDIEDK